MPELAEVESARRVFHDYLLNKKVANCLTMQDTIVFADVEPKDFAKHMIGKTIVAAHRKGKYFWVELDTTPWPVFHLGMSGAGHLKGTKVPQYRSSKKSDTDEWPPKYWKCILEFEDGTAWAYTDVRRLGRIRLVESPSTEPPISLLGFDPYLNMPSLEEFAGLVSQHTMAIKALLLDQSFSAGVGNWIADEVMYQAHIHPSRRAHALNQAEVQRLHKALTSVVQTAVDCADQKRELPEHFLFHYRWSKREKAPKDYQGNTISFVKVGGRTSAIVAALQKPPGKSELASPSKRKATDHGEDDQAKPRKKRTKAQAHNDDLITTSRFRDRKQKS